MKNILEFLENSANSFPGKTAVKDESGAVTYGNLEHMAKATGSALIRSGVEVNKPIPVYMEKGIDALCAFFGIVYAGGFYVLLNPDLPDVRLQTIVETLSAEMIITDKKHLTSAEKIFNKAHIVDISELNNGVIDNEAILEVRKRMIDIDPLYANFTSGSTGVPKGVLVSHRSVIDFIPELISISGIETKDVIANQAPFDFDVSVKDIYCAMAVGAELVIVQKGLFSKPAELIDCLCENDVTTMIWAVSALCLITALHGLDYKAPAKVKRVMFSGEVMPEKHLKVWMEKLPNCTFINLYGPTEITCNCTYHVIDRNRNYEGKYPIGKAFNNERVFLLDENGEYIINPETEGEICVSGTALAIGYYRDREQTEKVFNQNRENRVYYERIYHTGDLGYRNVSGELFFSGRKDFQIKHQGHRIELEEIERAVSSANGVERCCCVYDEERSRLYAFYMGEAENAEILKSLAEELPTYMIPNKLIKIDAFPLTKNGKVDRKELKQLASRPKHDRKVRQ